MTLSDLQTLLARFPGLDILVVGDFFLDRYLAIDPDLAETSLETGLDAHQVIEIRNQPGAAGTVTSNLCALGVGRVRALGIIGKDGQGYDLLAGLNATGVETAELIQTSNRVTPTYTKPINKKTGAEMSRFDIKNRQPLPVDLEVQVIDALTRLVPQVHGIIALDQVQERNCGILTNRVTGALSHLSQTHPDRIFFADSRTRIGDFKHAILKPNRDEALASGGGTHIEPCARAFSRRTGKPVFVTLGADGILVAKGDALTHVPGIAVPPPIDIVGAGDSVSASVVSALCAGASLPEAALLGVLVSSITIQQLGTTGTASPDQIRRRFRETYPNGWSHGA